MPLPTPGAGLNWTPGLIPTAAQLNAMIRDYIGFLCAPPMFDGTSTVAQALSSGTTYQAVNLDTINADTYSGWSIANKAYFIQQPGWYLVAGVVEFTANATGYRTALTGNKGAAPFGDTVTASPGSSGVNQGLPVRAKLAYLSVGASVQLLAQQNSGAALNSLSGCGMSILWVHA